MSALLLVLGLSQGAPLPAHHRAWLEEEVHFLISSHEQESFLALPTDEARDRFVQQFWTQRDPTPGTARNEARERHLALLTEADRLFTLVGSRRGRFTDRGRIYQLLGPPQSRDDFTRAQHKLYPLELWHYTGITESFLPETFYLVFFREGGFGDYRLWSPTADGPQALVKTYEPGRFILDERYAFEELKSVDFELAMAVQRLVPGEGQDAAAFASESLLTNLRNYPNVAERHLRFQGRVTSRVSFGRLEISPVAVSLSDSTGIPQVHYALEMPSSNVQWEAVQDRFRTSFSLSGRVVDTESREVDRIEDSLDLDLSAEEKANLAGVPLSFQGRLVLPPGRYDLEFTLSNTTGTETEAVSVPVDVRGPEGAGASDLLLARSLTRLSGGEFLESRPFQLEGLILSPSPDRVFPATEAVAYMQLWGLSGPAILSWNLSRGEETVWESESRISPGPCGRTPVEQVIPLDNLADGAYTLSVRFPGGNRQTELTVAGSVVVPRVRVLSREALPAGHGGIRYQRGVLFARRGETEKAIDELTEAARLLPRDLDVHLKLAYLLAATSQHQKLIDLLRPIEPHYPNEVDLLVFLGFASVKLGEYQQAVSYYGRALAQRPGDERLKATLAEAKKLADTSPKQR